MSTLTVALLCALAAAALAAPQRKPEEAPIRVLTYNVNGPNPDGSYSYSYETLNGIRVQEQGQLVKSAGNKDALRVQGSFSYLNADDSLISLSYVADENGFQPKGDHLPTIPAGILKALEYIAAHPEEDNLRK